ncbi:MAG: iron ABC transporter permease, partial [Gemmatimonadetes bacterium]|nr:iron ABC transporter permease [Gemmatimonadota bacterium]
ALASFATAASVAASGVIGFVGLVVPHTVRLLWGGNLRLLLPASILLGAAFLALMDALARVAVAPAELPIGVVTALVGVPFFVQVLRRRPA